MRVGKWGRGLFVFFFAGTAAAAEVPLADFARHAQFRSVKISPDGDYLAANSVIKGKAVLSLMRVSDLKGVHLSASDDRAVSDCWWVAPPQVRYTTGEQSVRREAPYPTGELYVVDADGDHHKLLYGGQRGMGYVVGELISVLPDDPKHALISRVRYGSRESYDTQAEAHRIDLGNGHTELLAKAPLRNAEFLADNEGNVRVSWGVGTDWKQKVYYRADAAAEWKLVFDRNRDKQPVLPRRFDRDGKNVYVECDGANGVGGICRWDLATHQLNTLWSGRESGPMQLVPTTDRKDVFAVTWMPGRAALDVLDKKAPEAKMLIDLYGSFQGERVSLGASTRDGRKRIVFVDGDVNPGEFYLYDSESKQLSRLLSAMPWINPDAMAPMEPIQLAARDGLRLHGYLTRPPGKSEAKHLPLVVLVHGGPYFVRDEWGFDPDVQVLASRGYAVLQVNFRGSEGYGAAFANAGVGEWGGKMQDDVTDATRWAIKEGITDADRICIYGISYGGYAALEGAVKEPDLYRCAIGSAGVYDLNAFAERSDVQESKQGRAYLSEVLGEDKNDLAARSPITHLDKLKAKVMLIVGGADRRVPPDQGRRLHEALDERKIEHEWFYRRTEGHGFYNEKFRTEMYERMLAFLDRNIGAGARVGKAKDAP